MIDLECSAVADGPYRYWLRRDLADVEGARRLLFVMLNPSTADASEDDPTIRRCIGFARAHGCASFGVVNLFALRATKPEKLWAAPSGTRIGEHNDAWIAAAAGWAGQAICAWGARPARPTAKALYVARSKAVLALLAAAGQQTMVLGLTDKGEPRHPLYVKSDARLALWPAGAQSPSRPNEPG